MSIEIILETTQSTQQDLRNLLLEKGDLPHLSFVQAKVQTQGRGRQDRAWVSKAGNLYLSLYLKNLVASSWPVTWMPHRLALAIREVIFSFGLKSDRMQIKWPNDVLIDRRFKIAGILCENVGVGIIAGVGVNIENSPQGIDKETTSLLSVLGTLPSDAVNEFRRRLMKVLSHTIDFQVLKSEYEKHSLHQPGDLVKWGMHQGQFQAFGSYGELIILQDGKEKSLFSEDIR